MYEKRGKTNNASVIAVISVISVIHTPGLVPDNRLKQTEIDKPV